MDDGNWLRTIRNISGLYDVTVTTDPAYTQTDVSVRSIEEMETPEEKPVRMTDDYYKSLRNKINSLKI